MIAMCYLYKIRFLPINPSIDAGSHFQSSIYNPHALSSRLQPFKHRCEPPMIPWVPTGTLLSTEISRHKLLSACMSREKLALSTPLPVRTQRPLAAGESVLSTIPGAIACADDFLTRSSENSTLVTTARTC